jgi:hypothetical protein
VPRAGICRRYSWRNVDGVETVEGTDGIALPQFAINTANSAKVADLTSIAYDLEFVIAAIDELAEIEDLTDPAMNVRISALWQAATIAYRRCFASGKAHGAKKQARLRIPREWVSALGESLDDFHQKLISLADQHVAHRVSDAQQALVLVQLAPEGEPRSVVGVGVVHMSLQLPDQFVALGRRLAVELLAIVQRNIQNGYDAILTTVRSADIDEVYKLVDVSTDA